MVLSHNHTHGLLQMKDEQMSEKSEVNSIGSENPARIEDIFEWIDGIPLSKTTKNLARDFSDAVLMSEILKFYYPHLVNSHNYIPANSIHSKKENWNTLNRKVLSRIDMRLNQEFIDQLAHSQVGAIEKLLNDFRDKQMATKIKDAAVAAEFIDTNLHELEARSRAANATPTQRKSAKEPPRRGSILGRSFGAVGRFLAAILRIFLSAVCFWRWFASKAEPQAEPEPEPEPEPKTLAELEEQRLQDQLDQLRQSYAQSVEELRVKADVIKTLCHKVAFLEGTMKLKDMKIAGLTNQLEAQHQFQLQHQQLQTPAESTQAKLQAGSPQSKIRKRPPSRTQI